MSRSTHSGEVLTAIQMKSKADTMWIAVARTSEWNNDDNPEAENKSTDDLSDVIRFIKVSSSYLAREKKTDEQTERPVFTYANKEWVRISESDAYSEQAKQLFLEASFDGDDVPNVEYRQLGLFAEVELSNGASGTILEPSDIQSRGVLLQYQNDPPTSITADNAFNVRFFMNFDAEKRDL